MRDPKCFHVQSREDQSVARAADGRKTSCQKDIKRRVRNPGDPEVTGQMSVVSAPPGRGKAANDPAAAGVPDRVGSGDFCITKTIR